MVKLWVLGGIIAKCVAEQFVFTPGFVLDGVEEGAVVVGPFQGVESVGNLVGQQVANRQIFDEDCVMFAASGVGGVGEQGVVWADAGDADAEIFCVCGQGVFVEQDFFRRVEAALFAAVDFVLLSGFGAGVVVEARRV